MTRRTDVVVAFLVAAFSTGTVTFWWCARHAHTDERTDAPRCLR